MSTRLSQDMEEAKMSQMTMPIFSTKWAIGLCVCNFLVPGLGTCMAGLTVCCPCSENAGFGCGGLCHSACLQFGIALLQLLLTPVCLVGWIWSCVWGCAFIARSNPEWRARRRRQLQEGTAAQEQQGAAAVTLQPTSAAGGISDWASRLQSEMRRQTPFLAPPAYRRLEAESEESPPSYEEAVREAEHEQLQPGH